MLNECKLVEGKDCKPVRSLDSISSKYPIHCMPIVESITRSFLSFHDFFRQRPQMGSMTYAFTYMGNFLLLLLLQRTPPQIPVLRPKSLGIGIWALGLGLGP